ncbi:MAG TPA: hypothetical protein VGX76_20015, partial [Pirellulales bacterium]|nr:hypothetical protein [Pirellulales bacterium]
MAQKPVEVQLHVSTNQGMTWEVVGRVKPEKGGFQFRAAHDGEYWFSIRTLDKQGAIRPDGALEPQLQVIVDTVAPRLDLTAIRGDAGEIATRWQAVDPHLKPDSFKLEYQSTPTGPWERLAVESPPGAMRHTLSGESTWWPRTASDSITVRAEISDLAGNPAVSQAVVKLDAAPRGDVARAAPSELAKGDARQWPADRSSGDPLARSSGQESRPPEGIAGDAWRGHGENQPQADRRRPAQT